jgi:hypothetical protein
MYKVAMRAIAALVLVGAGVALLGRARRARRAPESLRRPLLWPHNDLTTCGIARWNASA